MKEKIKQKKGESRERKEFRKKVLTPIILNKITHKSSIRKCCNFPTVPVKDSETHTTYTRPCSVAFCHPS